eukprot:10390286-Lingulodinium_polyedra.AAC.1
MRGPNLALPGQCLSRSPERPAQLRVNVPRSACGPPAGRRIPPIPRPGQPACPGPRGVHGPRHGAPGLG